MAVDEIESLRNARCVELRTLRNILVAFCCLPRTCAALWHALGSVELAHARLAREPARLAEIFVAWVARAPKLTHQEMHRERWRLPKAKFPMLTRPA